MATTPGVNGSSGSNNTQNNAQNDALRGLDLDQFLKLMITELQNQDPLNPMDNTQILTQIGEMRQIAASTKLTDTLDAMLLGQSLASASNMIGKSISGLGQDGKTVEGVVDRVSVTDGVPMLHIGDKVVRLSNVREINGVPVTDTDPDTDEPDPTVDQRNGSETTILIPGGDAA